MARNKKARGRGNSQFSTGKGKAKAKAFPASTSAPDVDASSSSSSNILPSVADTISIDDPSCLPIPIKVFDAGPSSIGSSSSQDGPYTEPPPDSQAIAYIHSNTGETVYHLAASDILCRPEPTQTLVYSGGKEGSFIRLIHYKRYTEPALPALSRSEFVSLLSTFDFSHCNKETMSDVGFSLECFSCSKDALLFLGFASKKKCILLINPGIPSGSLNSLSDVRGIHFALRIVTFFDDQGGILKELRAMTLGRLIVGGCRTHWVVMLMDTSPLKELFALRVSTIDDEELPLSNESDADTLAYHPIEHLFGSDHLVFSLGSCEVLTSPRRDQSLLATPQLGIARWGSAELI